MKKSWQGVMIIAALSIVFGSVTGVSAQRVEAIAGAYAETSNTDPEVVAAAKYAVRAEGYKKGALISLLSIERAEVQVVAGLNYRLRLRVRVNNKTQDVSAVVYKNLRRKHSLTSWEADSNHTGSGVAAPSNPTIQQLAKSVADAFSANELGSLDAERPYLGSIRIVIEHSLGEDKDRFENKTFKTLRQAEQWLKSLARADGPARNAGSLLRCSKGVCTFEQTGMLHNNLYLKKISYGLRQGRPYLKTIFLLDGD